MEKQTRVNKYKELREEMKEEVAIDRIVVDEKDVEDDDFLAFLPRSEKPSLDDTLVEPLSYETLKNDNETVRSAIHLAKENVGKDQYNTRLDILNKIKQEDIVEPVVQKNKEPQKKMSLLEKLAAMSPEEDAEELRKYEEGLTVADFMSEGQQSKELEDTKFNEEPVIPDDEEDEETNNSKIVTILNYVIVAFIVIFIILACFIVKQLFF